MYPLQMDHGAQCFLVEDSNPSSHIAVKGFSGMNKETWGTGKRQRRGNLSSHVAGFAHTGQNDVTLAFNDKPEGCLILPAVEMRRKVMQRISLFRKRTAH